MAEKIAGGNSSAMIEMLKDQRKFEKEAGIEGLDDNNSAVAKRSKKRMKQKAEMGEKSVKQLDVKKGFGPIGRIPKAVPVRPQPTVIRPTLLTRGGSPTPSDTPSMTPSLLSEMEEFQKRNTATSSSSSSAPTLSLAEGMRLLDVRTEREAQQMRDYEDSLDRANPFNGNNSMSQSDFNNPPPIDYFGRNNPDSYTDQLGPESQLSQSAYDREEYMGVDSNLIRNIDARFIEMRRREDAEAAYAMTFDRVREAGVLAGSDLLNKDSFRDPAKDYDGEDRYGDSGFRRGRTARNENPDIDLENLESAFEDDLGFYEYKDQGLATRGAMLATTVQPQDQIRGFIDQSEQKGGRFYAEDSGLEQSNNLNDRMSRMNIIRRTKDSQIDKFTNRSGKDAFLRSQGASMASISELRNKEVDWKQPSRSFKNTQVGLVRKGVRTGRLMDSEFEP